MGNKALNIFVGVILVLSAEIATAKSIYFGGATETVPIAYGGQTILRFEEAVKTISNAGDFIIKPVNEETPDYALLSVEPRVMTGKSDTVFILSGGDVAKLRLSVVPRQNLRPRAEPVWRRSGFAWPARRSALPGPACRGPAPPSR